MGSEHPAVVMRVLDTFRGLGCTGQLMHVPHNPDLAQEYLKEQGSMPATITHIKMYRADGDPLLVVIKAPQQPDRTSLASALGIGHLSEVPDRVARNWTNQEPKAIAPISHPTNISVVIDMELSRFSTVWVPAGHPEYLFATSYAELLQITAGTVAEIVAQRRPNRSE